MNRSLFWRNAANWGFLLGLAVFLWALVVWGLRWEPANGWLAEGLLALILMAAIWITGRKNASLTGDAGYSYGEAVGFVFALMLFAGIVSGVGQFVIYTYIAPEYYADLIGDMFDRAVAEGNDIVNQTGLDKMKSLMISFTHNPFVMIFSGVFDLAVKGGFLGLIFGAFLKRLPEAPRTEIHGDE